MRYALVNQQSGIVENVIAIDDLNHWPVPGGFEIKQSDTANIDDVYSDGAFSTPEVKGQ
jgi:hypothetical protein